MRRSLVLGVSSADAAPQLYFAPQAWYSWRRGTDFYSEDTLNWLWVDAIIRQQSKSKKSIDDFCHIFHGGPNTGPALKTYTFDDVANALVLDAVGRRLAP